MVNKSRNRTLILGGSGFLGSYFGETATAGSTIQVTNASSIFQKSDLHYRQIRFDSADSLIKFLGESQVDRIVNCIALANIEKCDTEPEYAQWLNVEIPKTLAKYCSKSNIKLTHISTDAVFNGEFSNRKEDDEPNPISVYGVTKLEGEREVLRNCPEALVARVNFFGNSPTNASLFDFFYSRINQNIPVPAYKNVFFTPLYARETVSIIRQLQEMELSGIFHVTGSERISKFDFALRIAETFDLSEKSIIEIDAPINKMEKFRGYDLSLSNKKIRKYGIKPQSIVNGLLGLKSEIEGRK